MLVGWFGWVLFYYYVCCDWISGFVIFGGYVCVVDVWESECYDLVCIGWVGYDFLVVGYCCVEI